MFYSQFILAKKGPLGTIWIAAHLERKLRKNQVSDTDIGVSVDSILFPEMPIALRLSSHLLLGVVRIYSKKVSYLFDDCSEALLKVKNAFRANAVDLPPEESTAPYHAITLPETFDLDDFELPGNENYQGSFVDHHVGARDQITLQDTMEGVVYTTSEFGRDERFGDGEASYLDLNEEVVVEKAAATAGTAGDTLNSNVDPQASFQEKNAGDTLNSNVDPQASFQEKNAGDTLNSNVDPQASFQAKTAGDTLNSNVDPQASFQAKTAGDTFNSNVDPQASFQAKTPLKDDENEDALSDDDGVDQMEDSDGYDDGDADYVPDEYAEGPSTPGLWEEPNLPKVQETPVCVDHQEPGNHSVRESVNENLENASQKVTEYVPHQQEKSTAVVMAMGDMSMNDFGSTRVIDPYVADQVRPVSINREVLGNVNSVNDAREVVKNIFYGNAMPKEHGFQPVSDNRENWVRAQGNLENAYHPTTQLVSNSETLNEHENNAEPVQLTNVATLHSFESSTREKPSNFFGGSGLLQGEGSHAANTFDLNLQEIHFTQPDHNEDQMAHNLYNEQPYNVNQGGNTNSSTSHFAAPERLLGVQERFSDVNQGVNTNIYTNPFTAPERLLPVQERFSDVIQQDKTNFYTSHFPATERLPAVQERFLDVNQANDANIYTSDFSAAKRLPAAAQERFSIVNQGNNTNIYTSDFPVAKRLPAVQERFSDLTQGNNTNIYSSSGFAAGERLLSVQERFTDVTQGDNTNSYTQIPVPDRVLGVQERFSDVTHAKNTHSFTSQIPASERLLGVQESFSDVTHADNTHSYTSQNSASDRLLGVQERFPNVTQGNSPNNYTSHFPAAERLLAVQERFSDAVLRQSTPMQENIVRGNGGHFASDMLTGKKRSITESLRTQTINFGEPSASLLTSKTTAQSVPNNDDVLSSILVGRSSVMNVKPTPPPKRRRQSLPKPPKTGVPKRKVPMDESTVLHGDMIRQQLTDTSDIRRPRKKVSCTWLELSMIHKQLWEDMIFHEALFTGVSIKLASLHNRSYDLRRIRVSRKETSSEGAPAQKPISQNDENVAHLEVANEKLDASFENLPKDLHEANNDVWVENNTSNQNYDGNQEQMNATNEGREPISSETATIETDAPLQSIQSDEKTDLPSVVMDSCIDINNKYIDTKNDEIKIDIASPEKISEAKDELLVVGPEIVTIDQEMEEIGKNEEETLKPEVECNEKNLAPDGAFGKELEADTENVTEVASCSKDVLLDDEEFSDHQDAYPEETTDTEDDSPNNKVDGDDLEYSAVQNNTDFLNFDDEDDNDAEEADEDLSDTEAKRLTDNSGWSSRTKAVGKYLQTMFDKEGEHGRMALRMNSLLSGKTRKEASRMFFETLVLKTKDYIHVEQSDPFENIDILPRSKLLKSEF